MIDNFDKILVIAPHPDDETLGVGGTIARLSDMGKKVSVLFVSGHLPPIYKEKDFEKTKLEALHAMKILGVKKSEFLKIPATTLSNYPVVKLNSGIKRFFDKVKPNVVFIPFPDRHIDHRVIFDASVVTCRPVDKNAPKIVLAYETLSETHWNVPGVEPMFSPEFFVDISKFLKIKSQALNCYESQINENSSRSVVATEALAKFRGSQNGCLYAEAFKVVRIVF
jgi:N-acetylglucosamine malate deacetylase 1